MYGVIQQEARRTQQDERQEQIREQQFRILQETWKEIFHWG